MKIVSSIPLEKLKELFWDKIILNWDLVRVRKFDKFIKENYFEPPKTYLEYFENFKKLSKLDITLISLELEKIYENIK